MNPEEIIVSIQCLAYNHEAYIRQCLDGFIMQKTTFRFEAIVHDDASTDGTATIIKEYENRYPEIIKPIYQTENQYSKKIYGLITRLVTQKCVGKYIAICEGDDFWTDPLKLQKQVVFLESHPDYSMCFHAVNLVKDNVAFKEDKLYKNARDITIEQIIRGGGYFCSTNSLCFKRTVLLQPVPQFRKMADTGDYPLQIQLALNGKVRYFPEIMGCYRVMSDNGWSARARAKGIPIRHYINMVEWLTELDKETKGEYRNAIYYKLSNLMFRPMRFGQYPFDDFLLLFNQIKIRGLISSEYVKYSKMLFYVLASKLIVFFKRL